MFSFHKPKVYRSSAGCCICKAKSSSSRFTDSRKYENDFQECFQLSSPRQGEICNACVLLVKRFKRLPAGSERHWGHVVDARAGPGMKCMSKFKKKRDEMYRSEKRIKEEGEAGSMSEESWSDDDGASDEEVVVRARRKPAMPVRNLNANAMSDVGFLDSNIWKMEAVCCGIVWKGPNGSVVLDSKYFKPCAVHPSARNNPAKDNDTPLGKFSDNSSDSGYDESSNPSLGQVPVPRSGNGNSNANGNGVVNVKAPAKQLLNPRVVLEAKKRGQEENPVSVIKQHPHARLLHDDISIKLKGVVIVKQKYKNDVEMAD